MNNTIKPYRNDKHNSMIAGVCGGISNSLNIDSTLIRIGFVVGTLFAPYLFGLGYIGLAIFGSRK